MGCYDPASKKWCTVTKCSGGYDDAMLARLQKELDVIKISKVMELYELSLKSCTQHYHFMAAFCLAQQMEDGKLHLSELFSLFISHHCYRCV